MRRSAAALSFILRPCLLACALIALPHPIWAAQSTQDELSELEKELESAQKERRTLDSRHAALEEELKTLRQQLVSLAARVRQSQLSLSETEDKLRILSEQATQRESALKSEQQRLSSLVRASISLSHTPAEAMIMMPGDVNQTMKTARALKMASDSVREQTQSIAVQLAELESMKDKVEQSKKELANRQEALHNEQQQLALALDQRRNVQKTLAKERTQLEAHLADLARKTKDLKELVSSIEEERRSPAASATAAPEASARSAERNIAAAKGKLTPPVRGKLVQRYGEKSAKNSTSRGLALSVAAGSTVVAPFDGEVVFTGPFLAYGDMVILRHGEHFHSLLAGLGKIEVSVGEFLLEGEPIGAMGEGEGQKRLYMELREHNQPVNPAPWIRGL